MARKKSYRDIERQWERINRLTGTLYGRTNDVNERHRIAYRSFKAYDKKQEYVNNIVSSSSFQNTVDKDLQKAYTRQYSQATYMGTNAG